MKRQRTVNALLCFSIPHLARRGYEVISLGGSRPFLMDGVLRFKKGWGARLAGGTERGFLLSVEQPSAGASAFLEENPFIIRENGQYAGVVFVAGRNGATAEAAGRLGLAGLEHIHFYRSPRASPDPSDGTTLVPIG